MSTGDRLDAHAELIQISRRFGADSAFVLAGGGNTSQKTDERLWVKASGHALATIDADGFVALDRSALQQMLQFGWPANAREREALFLDRVMAARLEPDRGQRPSVEALLHHLIPETFVVHTHPGLVNAITCCAAGEALTRQWWGEEVLWQPYVDPGAVLAQALQRNLSRAGKSPKAIFLQNHGLIVAGHSADQIDSTSTSIVTRIERELDASIAVRPPAPIANSQSDRLAVVADAIARERPMLNIAVDDSSAARWLAGTSAGRDAAMSGPLTPDQIVYCRSFPLLLEMNTNFAEAWQAYVSTYGWEPWIAIVSDAGVIAMRSSAKLAETTRSIYADAAGVHRNAERFGGVTTLSASHREFIEQWEVEAYRRSIAAGDSTK